MSVTKRLDSAGVSSRAIAFRELGVADGALLWRMAKESGALDLNSPYAYLMWCDHFARTSVLVEVDDQPAGFVLGFRPPDRPDVLFVWQVAVAARFRGLRLASRMLDALVERLRPRVVEATVTPSNEPSQRLFRSLARRENCACSESPCFEREHFPNLGHEPEALFRIGPITHDTRTTDRTTK